MACTLASDSWHGVEDHDSVAAGDWVVDWSWGFGEVGFDSAVANGRWVFPVRQQNPRPLDPARWLVGKPRKQYGAKIGVSDFWATGSTNACARQNLFRLRLL